MENKEMTAYVVKAQCGNQEAFEKLYLEYFHYIKLLSMKIVKNEADAQDIAQETFIQAHKSLTKLRDVKSFKSWLSRITINKCNGHFEKRNAKSFSIDDYDNKESFIEHYCAFVPHDTLNDKTDTALIHKFLLSLKEMERNLLILQYFGDQSMEQISEIMGMPVGTVKSSIYHAKKKLAKRIHEFEVIEGRRIGFKVTTVESTFLFGFLLQYAGKIKTKAFKIMKSQGSILLSGACACAVLITGASQVIKERSISPSKYNIQPIVHSVKEPNHTLSSPFPSVSYKDHSYTKAKDVFYILADFVANEKVNPHSVEEKQSIAPLYQSLKDYQGPYWDMLTQLTFDEFLEGIII